MQSAQPERKSDKEKLFARIRNEKVTLFINSATISTRNPLTRNQFQTSPLRDYNLI